MLMRNLMRPLPAISLLLATLALGAQAGAERSTLSLDGRWEIADGLEAERAPLEFTHHAPVPGLANLAKPGFEKVDAFYSREQLANRIRAKLAPDEWLTNYWKGKVDQDRNYFWYQKTFRAPAKRAVALLKINKAQFGTAVWLNGQKLGEYAGCFTASYFTWRTAIHWGAENTLLIRIGAHPAVLPDTFPTGSDFEKIKWTPGIYDSVSVIFCDNPLIESDPGGATNRHFGDHGANQAEELAASAAVRHRLRTRSRPGKVRQARRPRARRKSISLQPRGRNASSPRPSGFPNARLWSPEDPFLYVRGIGHRRATTCKTRFGMREFQFDGATRRAYLNGKVYYLRGSNITLHRFFEDPLCRTCPGTKPGCESSWANCQENALELFPVLHRPGAGPLVGDLRRSGLADPERVLRLDRRPRLVQGLLPRRTMPTK